VTVGCGWARAWKLVISNLYICYRKIVDSLSGDLADVVVNCLSESLAPAKPRREGSAPLGVDLAFDWISLRPDFVYGDPVDWSFKRYMACNLISRVNILIILDAQTPHAVANDRHRIRKVRGRCLRVILHSLEGIKAERALNSVSTYYPT